MIFFESAVLGPGGESGSAILSLTNSLLQAFRRELRGSRGGAISGITWTWLCLGRRFQGHTRIHNLFQRANHDLASLVQRLTTAHTGYSDSILRMPARLSGKVMVSAASREGAAPVEREGGICLESPLSMAAVLAAVDCVDFDGGARRRKPPVQ